MDHHTTYVYIADDGSEVLITDYGDGNAPEVATRPHPGAIWSPPLELERQVPPPRSVREASEQNWERILDKATREGRA